MAVAAELYKRILDKIEANGYDNFNTRAYLSREEKMMAVPPLWFKTVSGGWEKARQDAQLAAASPATGSDTLVRDKVKTP